jgi:hypothetical protein
LGEIPVQLPQRLVENESKVIRMLVTDHLFGGDR